MKWPLFLTIPRGPDFTVWQDDAIYLRRWWIVPRNRWCNIYLHNFRLSDDERALHDHRSLNLSIILSGAYFEHLGDGRRKLRLPWRPHAPWRLVFRRPATPHRVELIDGGRATWTLFVTGPAVREWGFHCPNGWVHWSQFVKQVPGGNTAGPGCDQ